MHALTVVEVTRERSDASAFDVVIGRAVVNQLRKRIDADNALSDTLAKRIVCIAE